MTNLTQEQQFLDIEFKCSDLDTTLTVREYFKTLLKTLWLEGEGFSGKRPLGNSDWEHDLYKALAKFNKAYGKVKITTYEDSDLPEYEWVVEEELNQTTQQRKNADKFIFDAIDYL